MKTEAEIRELFEEAFKAIDELRVKLKERMYGELNKADIKRFDVLNYTNYVLKKPSFRLRGINTIEDYTQHLYKEIFGKEWRKEE